MSTLPDGSHRTRRPIAGDEYAMLRAFLTYQRETLLWKVSGLDDEQLRRPHVPSGLTLLGLVKHLTDVERSWFREVGFAQDLAEPWDPNDPQKFWRIEPHETTAQIVTAYTDEIAHIDRLLDAPGIGPETVVQRPRTGREGMTFRWLLLHMIEETARHLGHADLIREAIDGQTGE